MQYRRCCKRSYHLLEKWMSGWTIILEQILQFLLKGRWICVPAVMLIHKMLMKIFHSRWCSRKTHGHVQLIWNYPPGTMNEQTGVPYNLRTDKIIGLHEWIIDLLKFHSLSTMDIFLFFCPNVMSVLLPHSYFNIVPSGMNAHTTFQQPRHQHCT